MATDYEYPAFGYQELVPGYDEKIEEAKKRLAREKAEKSESGLYFEDGKAYFAKPYDKGFTPRDRDGNTPMQDKMIAQDKRRSDETRANVREQNARLPQTIDSYLAQMRLKENPPKAKKEEFVAKDTLLGRIFDKRIKPGEDISNRDKASAMLRNLSDNLLERRLVGGKEGTDTLSRILGPSGGIREGMTEIEALETASISKRAAAVDKALDRKKKAYEIQKISSEAMKNIAELAKTDFTKATQEAMELAEFENFEPGTQAFDDQVAAILRGAVTEGQANVYTKLMQLKKDLAILPKGSPEYIAMEREIAEMKQRVGGTTLDNSYASEQLIDADGNPIT